jgi:enterochelin esterase-like enzyme
MSVAIKASRTQVWLESLGEWSWPGLAAEATEYEPPSWVPAFPPRLQPAGSAVASPDLPTPSRVRLLVLGALLSALAATCVVLALNQTLPLQRTLGLGESGPAAQTAAAAPARPPAPALVPVSHAAGGSAIDEATYDSAALHRQGSFLVYLPPGYASTTAHYPVLYLLHGNSQRADAFLQLGLQNTLDRLIAHHAIPPVIAVMIQGGPGANNWRDHATRGYESYILEVQQLVDRMLATVPDRRARAILGDSMGGYGAMHAALDHPYRFSVVESWLGFFNGLNDQLRADRGVIARLGMQAFMYGGESDYIADPGENAPFAAALRAAGATAHSAVYPGEHTTETLQAHLASTLTFAGEALAANAAARRRVVAAHGAPEPR